VPGLITADMVKPGAVVIDVGVNRVKGDDGSLSERNLIVRSSVHGPVLGLGEGRAYALRVAGLDRAQIFRQYYEMLRAQELAAFEAAMGMLQMPMFTTMYADREGHILHLFNGRVPRRALGDVAYWAGVIPGDVSETLWSDYHTYEELPRVVDPPSGWLQNANDPPWTTTFPNAIDPADYPPYMAPQFMHPRAQRSARMLLEDESITFEEMVAYKHSTRMELADRLLDDLLGAALESGRPKALAGVQVLEDWDRSSDADSRGAILFMNWAQLISGRTGGNPFAIPWDADDPMASFEGRKGAVLLALSKADGKRLTTALLKEICLTRAEQVELSQALVFFGLRQLKLCNDGFGAYAINLTGRYRLFLMQFGDSLLIALTI